MEVSLIGHTPDPELTVAAAARLCYSPDQVSQLLEGLTLTRARKLITKLQKMGHFSPFEHASFTFGIAGVSRSLSHQLVRHRIASYSQQSQRYVKFEDLAVVVPPTIAAKPEAQEKFTAAMEVIRDAYQALLGLVPAEDARYVLPNASQTNLVMTMNARSLRNFFALRCCARAQWEIRELAWRMLDLVQAVAPTLFADAGPNCWSSIGCQQGAMSCGEPPSRTSR
ncbi:MAG TPA: FAD-dependent thymidylate synthase [Firmicutes bacterium]|jgi:thymidylate synthase (FAD)|nr:FAD-dependent thymidylate synthase [Bacillota bacterium]